MKPDPCWPYITTENTELRMEQGICIILGYLGMALHVQSQSCDAESVVMESAVLYNVFNGLLAFSFF